ncbi:MAG: hypothetical protein R3A13_12525 [Bdellovibrionota bacterium]
MKLERIELIHKSLLVKSSKKKFEARKVLEQEQKVIAKLTKRQRGFSKIKTEFANVRKRARDPRVLSRDLTEKLKKIKKEKKEIKELHNLSLNTGLKLNGLSQQVQKINQQIEILLKKGKQAKQKVENKKTCAEAESLLETKYQMKQNSLIKQRDLESLFFENNDKPPIQKTEAEDFKQREATDIKLEYPDALSQSIESESRNTERVSHANLIKLKTETATNSNSEREAKQQAQNNKPFENLDSTVNSVNSWDVNGASGVELSVTTASGERYSLEIISKGNKTVEVKMFPESEKHRRSIWTAKKEILNALTESGYKINSFKIGGGYGAAA